MGRDNGIDIMANRDKFRELDGAASRAVAKDLAEEQIDELRRVVNTREIRQERSDLLATLANVNINFENTNQFFEFLSQAEGWVRSGTLPGAADATETAAPSVEPLGEPIDL